MASLPPDTRRELKIIFLRELSSGYRDARAAHESLLHDPHDARALEILQRFFHRVAGFASRVEMEVLGYLASTCERALVLAKDGHFPDATALFHMLGDGLHGTAAMLERHGTEDALPPVIQREISELALPAAIGEDRHLSKILVIDDDEFSAALIDHTLRSAGFVSSYCCDPRRAMSLIEEELPDLMILDVLMPELDGFELCRRVRSHPAMQFTPILFVTRKGDVEQRVRGLEVGANDYISKPFEPAELVARVRSHLQRLAALREMAIRDGLTRCFNHKYFKLRLDQEIARSRRYDNPLSIALIDVDHFKRINDQRGHPSGDLVLSHLSEIITDSVRSTDVVARYGGEEFAVLMVQAGPTEARVVANRIRERVSTYDFATPCLEIDGKHGPLPVTVSLGIACLGPNDESPAALIRRADEALYGAKKDGRNTVHVAA